MRKLVAISLFLMMLISCSSSKKIDVPSKDDTATKNADTIRIANDSLEYEVIIIDPGFSNWLNSQARPRGFYTENFLEVKNKIYVAEWNNRVMQPQRFNANLYEMQINYDYNIHYGYEVNYLLYNYMIYFQIINKQAFAGFVPNP